MNNNNQIPINFIRDNASSIRLERADDQHFLQKSNVMDLHRDEFFVAILVTEGELEIIIDFEHIVVHPKTLCFTFPGQIHRIESVKNCKLWTLFFDPKLIDDDVKIILEEFLFQQASIKLDIDEFEWFEQLFLGMEDVFETKKMISFKRQTIRSMLDAFIFRTSSIYHSRESIFSHEHSFRKVNITKKFKQYLRTNYKTSKKPTEYAELLHISVGYLNDAVREVTGFSTTYFIQQEIIREAMRLLCYSELSVKEIAQTLGYEDHKYFHRLFKKITNKSPGDFRKMFKNKNKK